MNSPSRRDEVTPGGKRPILRSATLFANFFLIITALYQLKPASRSLILESHGTAALPYIWIGSAVVLLAVIAVYQRILDRYSRLHVVLGSCAMFIVALVVFRLLLIYPTPAASVAFYIFVDIFGVIMVEQFWSLTDSVYSTEEGKRWYGIVGTGGLLGGAVSAGSAALLIKYTPLQTPDLLLVATAIVAVIIALTTLAERLKMWEEPGSRPVLAHAKQGWQLIVRSRYLILIAAALLLAQLVSPIVEYQFLGIIETNYPEREARTAVLSLIFSILSAVSVGVNILITPLVLRHLGVLAGLLVQPVALMVSAGGFMLNPVLWPAATMKISDRGLSYSINRAAKELLYIPVETVMIYRAKAWIDMFGYRIFKVAGAALILVLTQWTIFSTGKGGLSGVIIAGCAVWCLVLVALHREYRTLRTAPDAISP